MTTELHFAMPSDSRYVPFTQQDWCCVPTSIQMVMHRLGIPLLPAEEIGFHIGLTVSLDQSDLFYDARSLMIHQLPLDTELRSLHQDSV